MATQSLAKKQGGVLSQQVGDKDTLEALIKVPNFQDAVKAIIPAHLKPERLMKMALVAASRQPTLFKCTQGSILQSLMKSAELGLDCSGTLGHGYLVPYWNSQIGGFEAQFIPGYRGIIELAKRANPRMQIEARVVYKNDKFNFEYGLSPKLEHVPTLETQGDIQFFYCVSREPGLIPEFTVMTREEVDNIMERSKSRNKQGALVGPWKTDYAEMGRKTVTKRHAKYLSLSVEVDRAITLDDEQYRQGASFIAAEVSENVGIGAMKKRLNLVQQEPAPDGDTEPAVTEPLPVVDVPVVDEPETEPEPAVEPDPEKRLDPEKEAEEPEPIQGEPVEETNEEAEMRAFDLRKNAISRFRELEHEDPDAYLAANKWLGTKSMTELEEKKLTEFLKKFG